MADVNFGMGSTPIPFAGGSGYSSTDDFLAKSPIPAMPGEVGKGNFSGAGAPKQANVGESRTAVFNAGAARTDSSGQPAQGNGAVPAADPSIAQTQGAASSNRAAMHANRQPLTSGQVSQGEDFDGIAPPGHSAADISDSWSPAPESNAGERPGSHGY